MATKKISELEAINAAEDNDVLVIVDTSESTTNKITKGNLLIGAGHTIEMTLNENYQIVLILKNAAGTALSTQTIDLPNENAIINLAYNNGILTVTKQSGATSQINLTGLIEGLVTESDFNTFKEALQATLESINEKDAEQDEAISENYKVINKLNEKLENQQKVIDQLPQVPGQGTSITLENTIEAPFTIFDVEGNSTQESTEGRNYLPQAEIKSVTSNGVTITSYADGKFTIKGTPTAEFFANFNFPTFDVPANAYFHLRNTGNASYNYALKILYGSTEKGAYAFPSNNKIWQMNNEAYSANLFQFFCNSNAVGTAIDITLQPSIELTDAVTDFEKYTNGASPSPNWEQPILSSGDNIQLWGGFTYERSASGITFNQNADGTVTANGTATASVSSLTVAAAIELGICKTLAAGTYIVSGGLSSSLKVQVYDSNINLLATDTGSGSLFTLTEEKTVAVRLTVDTNVTVNNQTFYIKLEKGNKASGYSPYGMGSITEKIVNKNIVNWAKNLRTSFGGLTSVINADGSITTTGKPNYNYVSIIGLNITNLLENGKTYTLSQKINQGTKLYLQINAKNNTTGAMSYVSLRGATSRTFTADTENISYILNLQTGTTAEWEESELSITNYYQLEQGSTVTDFVPYEEQDYSIFVQQPFRSIEDVRDCFVKKSDGKLYERHYFGKVEQLLDLVGPVEQGFYFIPQGIKKEAKLLSTHQQLGTKTASEEWQRFDGSQMKQLYPQAHNGVYINYKADTKREQIDWWNSLNNILFYELEIPLDLLCTETQIQQLENKPSTYKDFTTINSEDETPAYLEVSGIRDINTMFDKVTNAIVSLGGNV